MPMSDDDLRNCIADAISRVDDWRGVTDPNILAEAVITVVQPLLEAEYNRGYNRGYDEGLDWLHDESRWIKADDEDEIYEARKKCGYE
jgi:hypothetical protein